MDNISYPYIPIAISMVIGGWATFYKPFIGSKEELKKRIDCLKKTIVEKHALKHTDLLNHFRSIIGTDTEFRGDGRNEIDYPGEFSAVNFRLSNIYNNIVHLYEKICFINYLLMLTVFAGIIEVILFLIWKALFVTIFLFSVFIIVIQIILILLLYRYSRKVDEYEDNT